MIKSQFVCTLKTWARENELSLEDMHVSFGGACLMLGLRTTTNDIDLAVTSDIFDRFDCPIKFSVTGIRYKQVTPLISIAAEHPSAFKLGKDKTGVQYRQEAQTLADYQNLDRPKDQYTIRELKRKVA